MARGLLSKVREGVYKASPKGAEYLKKTTSKIEKEGADRINFTVSLVVSNKIGRSKHELADAFGLLKNTIRPTPETQHIRDRIKKIYEDSVPDNDNSSELVRGMWAAHTKKTCKSHFDFASAYKKHVRDDSASSEIKKYWTENQLFDALHFYSLSTVERIKRNMRVGS
ncbi:MAG: hypothetical protein KGI08_03930 [Thaumarchaeota archaeon]|nr:hypothetical protein [Nitrososphaerota archaeon]